jgi:hypothetical protein
MTTFQRRFRQSIPMLDYNATDQYLLAAQSLCTLRHICFTEVSCVCSWVHTMTLGRRTYIIHFQVHLHTKRTDGCHKEVEFPGSRRMAYSRNNTGVLSPFPVVKSLAQSIWSYSETRILCLLPPHQNATLAPNAGSFLLLHWTESATIQGSELFSVARGATFVHYNNEMWQCRRNGTWILSHLSWKLQRELNLKETSFTYFVYSR